MSLRVGYVNVVRPLFKGNSEQVRKRSIADLRRMGQHHDFECVLPAEPVTDAESAEKAARKLAGESLDFLLLQHTTFAAADLLAPLLKSVPRVGLWAVPETAGSDTGRSGPLPLNSLCGVNMTLSYLDHPEVDRRDPVKWFYGEVESPWFQKRFQQTLAALRALKTVEKARILQIGGTAPHFLGLEEDPVLPGVCVEFMSLEETWTWIDAVSESEAKQHVAEWSLSEPDTRVSEEEMVRAARVELALERIAGEGDFQALAVRCWPEFADRCEVMACASLARTMDAGIPAACEGDVMGALSLLILQGISQSPPILMDLSDYHDDKDLLMFWHCGNAPLSWAHGDRTRLTRHFNRDQLGVVRDMILKPGQATGFRVLGGGSECLIFSGNFSHPEEAAYDGVRGWFGALKWNGDSLDGRTFIANVLDQRLPHHFAFGQGERTRDLRELCGWLGMKPLSMRPEVHGLS